MNELLNISNFIHRFKNNIIKINKDMTDNKEIISRLKFIGRVKKGEKINVKHMYVQPDSFTTKITRTFFTYDNRNNTVSFLLNTLSNGFQIIYLYLNSKRLSERHQAIHILNDIKNTKIGIQNLKVTYCEDTMFCCTLDTLLQDIDAKLFELEKTNPNFSVKKENVKEMVKEKVKEKVNEVKLLQKMLDNNSDEDEDEDDV